MTSAEHMPPVVRAPFVAISREEIAKDEALKILVDQVQPNAVIAIPQFPELVYLRTQSFVSSGVGAGYQVIQREEGLYYDRATKSLVDLEKRDDGRIVATEYSFSKHALLHRRHGVVRSL